MKIYVVVCAACRRNIDLQIDKYRRSADQNGFVRYWHNDPADIYKDCWTNSQRVKAFISTAEQRAKENQ